MPYICTGHWKFSYSAAAPTATTATAYSATTDIGTTTDGLIWEKTPHQKQYASDESGDVPMYSVNRGMEVTISGLFMFYDVILNLIDSQTGTGAGGASPTAFGLALAQVGYEMTGNAAPSGQPIAAFALSGVNQNPNSTPQTLFFPIVLVDAAALNLLMATDARFVQLPLRTYPQRQGATATWFQT